MIRQLRLAIGCAIILGALIAMAGYASATSVTIVGGSTSSSRGSDADMDAGGSGTSRQSVTGPRAGRRSGQHAWQRKF